VDGCYLEEAAYHGEDYDCEAGDDDAVRETYLSDEVFMGMYIV